MAVDSVLFIGFGGPTRPDEVMPYLRNVARGRPIPEERLLEVARQYERIGGRSPYNEATFRQARAVEAALAAMGRPLPCAVGMRNWSPYLRDAVGSLYREGRRHAVGVVLAPHRSEASWGRYHQNVRDAIAEAGAADLRMSYLDPWHADPLFVEALARNVEEASGHRRGEWPDETLLLFTAHSIPIAMASESRYAEEIGETCGAVAGVLQAPRWEVAYQSRSGPPRQPWLEPDVNDLLRRLGAEGVRRVVLLPVGFLCCHVEVLYDLDVVAQATAREAGVEMVRARTVEDHPLFTRMLAERILAAANAAGDTDRG